MALRCQSEPPRLHGAACVDGSGARGGILADAQEKNKNRRTKARLLPDRFLVGHGEERRVRSRAARRPRTREPSAAAGVAGRGVACVYLRRQRAICSCCCSGGSAVVSAMPPARSRRSILWTVRTSGRASLCRHRLQQMQARTLACTRMHECTRAPMPPHAAHCTPQTLRTPRSKLQLVPEQLVLLKGGHGADLATGARDPVAAKLARLPRRAAHAHVQLLQPPPGTRSSGIEQPSP